MRKIIVDVGVDNRTGNRIGCQLLFVLKNLLDDFATFFHGLHIQRDEVMVTFG